MKFIFSILILMLGFLCNLQGQAQLGSRLENYSGVNSLLLNPSSGLTHKLAWDVNLVSAGAFLQTNYAYVRPTNLFHLLGNLTNIRWSTDFPEDRPLPDGLLALHFAPKEKRSFLRLSADVMGPGALVHLGGGHSVGAYYRVRAMAGTPGLPPELNHNFINDTPSNLGIEVGPFKGSALSWSEIAANYSIQLESATGQLSLGATVKYLTGYESFYVQSNSIVPATRPGADSIALANLDLKVAVASQNLDATNFSIRSTGSGFGIDLGATLTIGGSDGDYQYKFGAALIDLGYIRFDQSAQRHVLQNEPFSLLNLTRFEELTTVDPAFEIISDELLGSAEASLVDESFVMLLPAALSLQADAHIYESKVYVNATLIQRIPLPANSAYRSNLLAITPRFEHRWFSAMLPLSLVHWRHLRLGASMRLGFLVLGSDNLGGILGRSEFGGADIYAGIKLNPFYLGSDKWRQDKSRRRGGGGKGVKCYEF